LSETAEVMQEFFNTAIEKMYQKCLELEANDFLGRDLYQRQEESSSISKNVAHWDLSLGY
jgi:hypothetical protein